MNRSTDALRWLLLPGLMLVLAGCAGLDRKDDSPEPDTSAEVPEPVVEKTPEERYADAVDLMRRNQLDEARAAFEALTVDAPEQSGPWTNLGLLHQRAKRPADARRAFETAVRLNPDNATAYNQLGMVLRETGQYPAARAAYESALTARPEFAEAHLNLGLLLDSHVPGARNEALDHYRRYLELQGGDDLRVLVWIAEIEQAQAAAAATTTDAPAAAEETP